MICLRHRRAKIAPNYADLRDATFQAGTILPRAGACAVDRSASGSLPFPVRLLRVVLASRHRRLHPRCSNPVPGISCALAGCLPMGWQPLIPPKRKPDRLPSDRQWRHDFGLHSEPAGRLIGAGSSPPLVSARSPSPFWNTDSTRCSRSSFDSSASSG